MSGLPIIIIPAYKPDESLIQLVDELCANSFSLIVINDGSGDAYVPIFTAISKQPHVTVLHHAVNLGKGQALKTAFNHFLLSSTASCCGVVTADADGQHLIKDIMAVAKHLTHEPQTLWLGVRTFTQNVPWRSRFGNNLTRIVFRFLVGQHLQDTQTGLRAIPRDLLKPLLKVSSVGYEFELDMLIMATRDKRIKEVPIETVYKNDNKGSHFNPLIDSLKIYFVFLRFLTFAIVSGLFDYCAFLIAFAFCQHILLSEALARIFSGTFNFLLNKELVFKSKQKILPEALKYALLCAVNLVFSYGLISSLVYLGANVYASKMIALIGLFIANFAIQNLFVFGNQGQEAKSLESG